MAQHHPLLANDDLAARLDALLPGRCETVITPACIIEVECTHHGSYARVRDFGSAFHGESAFAAIPSTAFWLLQSKLSALTEDAALFA